MRVYKEFSSSDRVSKIESVSAERGLALVGIASFALYLANVLGLL